MTGEEAGRDALRAFDEVLLKRPKKDDRGLTEATGLLCLYRGRLIEASRSGRPQDRERLSHLNAILSVVTCVRFPLDDAPWEELTKARGWLSELLDSPSIGA
jgi:hypothetical protein